MKLTNQSNKIKSRIVSVLAVIALIVSTVLSFVLILPGSSVLAEGGDAIKAKREANGIKFVQVAAGEDFAIGLTYDGKLYGWSLKETRRSDTDSNATLGDYYTTTPTEINVTFRIGPKNTYNWNSTGGIENYHTETNDKIKSIAATRKTAAFVTEKGYIYTWGKDMPYDVGHNESGQDHHLLLRAVSEPTYSWKTPYIIDYYYFGSTPAGTATASKLPLEQIIPTNTSYMSLAAGEYNYAFMFIRNYPGGNLGNPGNYFHTYVWGSMLYNAVNTEPRTSFNYGSERLSGSTSTSDARRIFNTFISEKTNDALTTGVSIAAGGYTVAINNRNAAKSVSETVFGTSLQLRGRNFITTQGVESNGTNYTVTNTTQVLSGNADGIASTTDTTNQTVNNDYGRAVASIAAGANTVVDAIAGGNGRNTQDGSLYGRDTEQYYARQKSSSNLAYGIDSESAKLRNSGNAEIDGLAATRYAVSLGNDIGYGISGGNIYGWGDSAYNQLQLGEDTKYSDLPTQLLGDKGANFISIAAGKQLSNSKAFSYNTTTIQGDAFADAVKNDNKYISAALTDNGTIYAWSKDIAAEELYFKNIGKTEEDAQKKDSFIAIYSGYGENLFAVTSSGKLVRITVSGSGTAEAKFEQHAYDEFNNASGTKIDNWTVNKGNKIVFKVPQIAEDAETAQKIAPELGSATFYVWSVAPSDSADETKTIQINNVTQEASSNTTTTNVDAYNALIGVNNIGDAYRIIGFKAADRNIDYLMMEDNLNNDIDDDNYYAPRYYFDGELMSDDQRSNMFDANIVYDNNGAGVGIYIKPKKSSKGKEITIKFKIARYNNYTKYNSTTDDAIYYDYKECEIKFSIEDTPSVITYVTHNETTLNSNIPLLDPNNPYNTYYSLAVQNVSLGVDKLVQFLTGEETVNDAFKNAIIAQMNAKDNGFPSSQKVSAGDLEYYLSTTDLAKYNNVYQYMFTDRDGDRVTLAQFGVDGKDPIISTDSNGVNGEIKNIEVKVKLADTGYALSDDLVALTSAKLLAKILTDFDNVYGLYGFAIDSDNNLTFKYDVIMFTATDASGRITYGGNQPSDAKVTGYVTSSGSSGARARVYANTINSYTYNADSGYAEENKYAARITANNIAYVYSQPTLRLKSDLEAGKVTDVNGQVSGSKNTYTVNYTSELYVGDSVTIKLDNYINHIDTANISFSFKNETNTDALKNFSDQFVDFTGQNMRVLSLDLTTITVSPTTAAPINFTVEVQRFANSEKTRYFTADNKPDEKIYITFNFNNIVGFSLNKNTNAQTTFLVTDTTTIELFGDASTGAIANNGVSFVNIMGQNNSPLASNTAAAKAYTALRANARIYGISSSEEGKPDSEKLFDFAPPTDTNKTKFTITPKRSGSGVIQFSANIYDKSQSFILTINVSKETLLGKNDMVTVIDDQYITVSALDEALRSSNSFNADVTAGKYRILYNDIKNPEATRNNDRLYNAIYFTNENGDVGAPSFVQNAVFETITSDPTIRIISSNSTTEQSKTYYMHVRYTNADSTVTTYESAPAGSIIEIVVPVVSGKIKLKTSASGSDLVADIDCRHTQKEGNWWQTEGEGLETKVTIDLKYLLDLDGTESPDKYKIFLLSADSSAAQYFQYDKGSDNKSIVITPNDNTPKNFELNVSVYAEGEATKVLSFEVSVKGIITTLPVMTDDGVIGYGNIWLYSFAIVFGVLLIIFVIRFIVYMRKRSKQRAIIKRNQDLIRLRDRMHGKANAATREQLVKAKLKMDDPKYAKAFNDMRKDKEDETGVTLENSDLAAAAEKKSKKKKKKGGKKTVAELKAELAAKKAAFAAAQAGNAQPVNPFATDIPIDGGFVPPDAGFGAQPDGGFVTPDDGGFVTPDGGEFVTPEAGFATSDIDGNEIIFDASDIGDGNM
ncbi:MAG: hypothetical protein K2O04_04355 [Clostridiales bacterium]|nr:hypothetical protein [Clostridiales bacterium]